MDRSLPLPLPLVDYGYTIPDQGLNRSPEPLKLFPLQPSLRFPGTNPPMSLDFPHHLVHDLEKALITVFTDIGLRLAGYRQLLNLGCVWGSTWSYKGQVSPLGELSSPL